MFFSIIVPVYNVEKYLRKCLDSIRMQSFRDFEVVVIDDGSTDKCPEICDEYSKFDDRFKVVHKKNGGLVSARKAGSELVSGDYILNVDSDDFIEIDLLKRLKDEISLFKPDMLAFECKIVNEKGKKLSSKHNLIEPVLYKENIDIIKKSYMYDKTKNGLYGGCLIFSIWTKAIKRALYKKYQSRIDNRITIGEDTLLNLYIINASKSILVSKIDGYCYRQQPTSMTHAIGEKTITKQVILVENLRDFVKIKNRYKNQIEMYIYYSSYMLLQSLVNKKTRYFEYRKYINLLCETGLFGNIRSIKPKNLRLLERIKIFLISNKLWFILFMYFKFIYLLDF